MSDTTDFSYEPLKTIPDLIEEAISSGGGQATTSQIIRYVKNRRQSRSHVIRATLYHYLKGGKSGQDRFLKIGRALYSLNTMPSALVPTVVAEPGSVEFVEKPVVVASDGNFKIEQLAKISEQGKVIYNREYQRSKVWPLPKSRLLIDSILRSYDINKIFVKQHQDGTLEIMDGQQRLESIFAYLQDNYALAPDSPVGEATFSQLAAEPRYTILFTEIDAVVVHKADDETISQIFLRLQEGMPLIPPERLNAMPGIVRNKVVETSSHVFMTKIGISKHRFAHRYLSAQVALLEMENLTPPEGGFRIVDVKFPSLVDMYEYGKKKDPGMFDRITKAFNFLSKSLGDDAKIIRQRRDFVPVYLLASYLTRRYGMTGKESTFHDFILKFLTKTSGVDTETSNVTEQERPYFDYAVARSKTTASRRSVEIGFQVILQQFLKEYTEIPLKDPQRAFDYGQKLAIYSRAGGLCETHEEKVTFDKAEFHHVKYWSKGGSTTVENGKLLCIACHDKVHKNIESEE